jgi:daunorubicin resistance ABC transporter ATP-binding subunit
MIPIIEAERLKKSYKRARALDGLDLVAESGRVLALLGPNGAGKTTFVRAVATLVKPDEGNLRVAGIDVVKEPARVREVIGLAGQYAAVEPAMTGRENLVMVGRLFGLDRAHAKHAAQRVLDDLDLGEHADRYVRTYSGGLRRRLDLGASLVGDPRLLLLDEPTTGLDPRSRNDLWNAIRRLVDNGTDVLLTTQYLDEADQLATDVVIIDHGKVVASGTPAELKAKAGQDVIELHPSNVAQLEDVGRALATLARDEPRIDAPTRKVLVSVENGTDRLTDAVRILDDLDIAVDDIALRRPTLDEVFLSLTGKEAS